jgi:hypothetical protein
MKIRFVEWDRKENKFWAFYEKRTNIIWIDKDLKLSDKTDALLHELGHYLMHKMKLNKQYHYVYDIALILFNKKISVIKKKKFFLFYTSWYFNE